MAGFKDKATQIGDKFLGVVARFFRNRAVDKLENGTGEKLDEIDAAIKEEFGGYKEFVEELIDPEDIDTDEVMQAVMEANEGMSLMDLMNLFQR